MQRAAGALGKSPACLLPTTPSRASPGRVLGNLGGTLSSESRSFWHQAGGGSRVDLGLWLLVIN